MSKIPLETLMPHGKIETRILDEVLELKTYSSITSIAFNLTGNSYKRHYLELPHKAHMPFTLSMQLQIDYSGLIFLIGDGHVLFNCPCNNAIQDPIKPSAKISFKDQVFRNKLPLSTWVNVKIRCGLREMQILVDGQEAFYTKKLPYMKDSELPRLNEEGFRLGFEVAKLTTLLVRQIDLTEQPQEEPIIRAEPYEHEKPLSDAISGDTLLTKPTFDQFVSRFPADIQEEIIQTDTALKALKFLKIKRTVDAKGDKLTYTASDYGISYIIRQMSGESWQSFSFYVVTAGKAETWHRKADYMEEVLQEIHKTNPTLAERIFFALNDCVGCYGAKCIVKTPYSFQGKRKLACHGVVMLRICHDDFEDIRSYFGYLCAMLKRKAAEGTLQTDKIYCIQPKIDSAEECTT